ncbi:SRPBCC family protein [Kitasatospora sp. NPDC056181]|uniref:SRPBCC family protein n=1 Tax=Kitasatospora sp. NPDC056181 TaxID=3345737 RepID=UPI0035DA2CFB
MTVHTIDESAPVIVRLTTTIHAPLAVVWSLHTDIDSWATWLPDVDRARLDGPLAPGAAFHWQTHGLDIASTLLELVPGRRIVWGGPANGIEGVHVWTFAETDGAVTVHTEESWSGAPVDAHPAELEAALRASLESWLDRLKAEAERC